MNAQPSRRGFLSALAAIGATALVAPHAAKAQATVPVELRTFGDGVRAVSHYMQCNAAGTVTIALEESFDGDPGMLYLALSHEAKPYDPAVTMPVTIPELDHIISALAALRDRARAEGLYR